MSNLSPKTVIPWIAAVAVLLIAWFIPLPGPVLSEDQFVINRMPQTRASVETARTTFIAAQTAYTGQIRADDPGPAIVNIRNQVARIRDSGGSFESLAPLLTLSNYAERLKAYAAAGETYFDALKRYDDDLMSWSRSLGAASESLRDDTFPIVEHVKLYPPPLGITPDPPYVSATEVSSQTNRLHGNVQEMSKSIRGRDNRRLVEAISVDVDNIAASGASIERVESLHELYYTYLKQYDGIVQATALAGDNSRSPSALAVLLNLLVGLITLIGVGTLFVTPGMSRKYRHTSFEQEGPATP